jgi:hypothetical protein
VQREAVAAIERAGGYVRFDWQYDDGVLGKQEPGWLRRHLGPGFFEEVTFAYVSNKADDALMRQVGRLHQLQWLDIEGNHVTDEGVKFLARLSGLRHLRLRSNRITDIGLLTVSGLSKLERLSLDDAAVTDTGLLHLARLKRCQVINVWRTKVTPAGNGAMKAKCPWMHIISAP